MITAPDSRWKVAARDPGLQAAMTASQSHLPLPLGEEKKEARAAERQMTALLKPARVRMVEFVPPQYILNATAPICSLL